MGRQSEYRLSDWREFLTDHALLLICASAAVLGSILLLVGYLSYAELEKQLTEEPSPPSDYKTPILPAPGVCFLVNSKTAIAHSSVTPLRVETSDIFPLAIIWVFPQLTGARTRALCHHLGHVIF